MALRIQHQEQGHHSQQRDCDCVPLSDNEYANPIRFYLWISLAVWEFGAQLSA